MVPGSGSVEIELVQPETANKIKFAVDNLLMYDI